MKRTHPVSSAALAVALLALVMSLGGASFAAKLITGKDIKNGSITGKDIKKKSLTGKLVKDKSLTGADVKDGSVSAADLAAGTLPSVVTKRVAATAGASEAAARTAAPEVLLFKAGALTVYAKCFTDSSGPDTNAEIYVKSAVNFSLVDSDEDDWDGGAALTDWLNPTTLETDREVMTTSAGTDSADHYGSHSADFNAYGGDGTAIAALLSVAAKNGTLAAGNGPYGTGDACLFTGTFTTN